MYRENGVDQVKSLLMYASAVVNPLTLSPGFDMFNNSGSLQAPLYPELINTSEKN